MTGLLFTPHLWLPKPGVTIYQGAGDALSGAYCWGGLRAYTLASIGSNALRLQAADLTQADFVTVAGGGLDLASINAFIAAHGLCTVRILYDQTGNGRDWSQSAAATQPAYSSTSGPGGLPGMSFTPNQYLSNTVAITSFVTLAYSFVMQANPDGVHDLGLGGDGSGSSAGFLLQRGVSVSLPNTIEMYAGNAFARVAATDNAWNAVNALNNTTTGAGTIEANGTQVSASVGFGIAPNLTSFAIGLDGSRWWRGQICEAAIWLGGSTTTIDTVNGNQRTYWGF